MKREVQNYFFMGLGFLIIALFIMWDLFGNINYLLVQYNSLVSYTNSISNNQIAYEYVIFFGEGITNVGFIYDGLLFVIIFLIIIMVFLKIKWSLPSK